MEQIPHLTDVGLLYFSKSNSRKMGEKNVFVCDRVRFFSFI